LVDELREQGDERDEAEAAREASQVRELKLAGVAHVDAASIRRKPVSIRSPDADRWRFHAGARRGVMPAPEPVERLLSGVAVSAHLATSVDDRPHVAPVWFDYRDGTAWVVTGGKKLANLRANPRVALSVEGGTGPDAEWAVTLLGTARVVEDAETVETVTRRLFERYEGPDADVPDPADLGGRLVAIDVGSAAVREF
jgi:general stress protein 26